MPRIIPIDEVKGLIGNLARPNYYQVQFELPLASTLKSYLRARGVEDRFIREEIGLLCNSAVLPSKTLASTESYNRPGIKENFAHTEMYSPLKLEFYVDNTYQALRFFNHWISFITSGDTAARPGQANYFKELRYPREYKTDAVRIYKFENDISSTDFSGINIRRFQEYAFIGLYPVDVYEIPVQYSNDGGIANITVSFNYDYHIEGSVNSLDVLRRTDNDLSGILRGSAQQLQRVRDTIDNLNSGNIGGFINV